MITVSQLKNMLENMPDDAKVVLPGTDHSYDLLSYCNLEMAEIKYNKFGAVSYILEYYGEQNREALTTKIEQVVVLT